MFTIHLGFEPAHRKKDSYVSSTQTSTNLDSTASQATGQGAIPEDDDAFDAFIGAEQYRQIQHVNAMESFLLRAARRFYVLDADQNRAASSGLTLPLQKQKAWEFCHWNFGMPFSDLRMFFSETEDFYSQTTSERRRLYAVADILVGSAKDKARIDQAAALGASGTQK